MMARPSRAAAFPSRQVLVLATFAGLPLTASGQVCNFPLPPAVVDSPDPGFVDSNGDGIDGMACGPIYVSTTGLDSNPGTRQLPMASVSAAVAAAMSYTPRRDIYVATGTYNGVITTFGPINIYGGFNPATWARVATRPTLSAVGRVLYADQTGSPAGGTLLSTLQITSLSSPVQGQSVVGLIKRGTNPLTMQSCVVSASNATAGEPGTTGGNAPTVAAGLAGGNGTSGDSGGGAGGLAPLGIEPGGRGGNGGYDTGDGQTGLPGSGGATGGAGGQDSACFSGGNIGGVGQNGAHGTQGTPGSGGAAATAGASGTAGTNGRGGGGGGGGGGGHSDTFCNADRGGGGGSGGCGGLGGGLGTGGGPGGSSIAILALAGSLVNDSTSSISTGFGGTGGVGGNGGTGSLGGPWGNGGAGADDAGAGNHGGNGGNGGAGGPGGGGGGGYSAGVMYNPAVSLSLAGTTFVGGPGLGGSGGTNVQGGIGGTGVTGGAGSALTADPTFMANLVGTAHAPTAVQCRIVCPAGVPSGIFQAVALDPDNDVTTYQLLTGPVTSGAPSQVGPSSFSFFPASGFTGWTSFGIRATDSTGGFVDGYAVVYVRCRADIDGNGVITPADVATFVSLWSASLSAGNLNGDWDGNGVVNPSDVAAFVSDWFNALSGGC